MGCGHTGVDFGVAEIRPLVAAEEGFPLDLVVLEGELYSDPRSPGERGRVVSIQGVDGAALLWSLRRLTSGDALDPSTADHVIDRFGPLFVVAVLGGQREWTVVLEDDGVEQTHVLAGSMRFFGEAGPEPRPEGDDRFLVEAVDLETGARHPVKDGVAGKALLLTFDTFPGPGKFRRKILRPMLRHLDEAPAAVIVDLRWNGGGHPFAAMDLFGHFIEDPSPSYSRRMMRDVAYADGHWKDGTRVGDLMDVGYGDEAQILPLEPRYDGPLVVLTSGYTFSTAADFAAFAKRDGRGILVGQRTGGSATLQTSGPTMSGTLRHSGLDFSIPLFRSVLADPDGVLGGAGVEPDVRVPLTEADLAGGRDRVLEDALEHLRSR